MISFLKNDTLFLDPNALIYTPYPRVNCLKTIPFTAAHTYIAHIWKYPPPPPQPGKTADILPSQQPLPCEMTSEE